MLLNYQFETTCISSYSDRSHSTRIHNYWTATTWITIEIAQNSLCTIIKANKRVSNNVWLSIIETNTYSIATHPNGKLHLFDLGKFQRYCFSHLRRWKTMTSISMTTKMNLYSVNSDWVLSLAVILVKMTHDYHHSMYYNQSDWKWTFVRSY